MTRPVEVPARHAPARDASPPAWYAGRAPVRVEVDCGGTHHHVTWRRGRLVLEDHDVVAERVLRGMGAEKARCVEVLDAWRDLNAGPALDQLSALLWGRRGPARDDRLPPALGRVAALATIVRCERRWDDAAFPDNSRRIVGHELTECFGAAIKASLAARRDGRGRVRVRSRCEMLPPEAAASLALEVHAGRRELVLTTGLPISWLVEVWGRGVASVDGHLVIDAAGDAPDRVAVAAVDWGSDSHVATPEPHLVTAWARRQGDEWHVDRDAPPPRLARRPWWSVTRT